MSKAFLNDFGYHGPLINDFDQTRLFLTQALLNLISVQCRDNSSELPKSAADALPCFQSATVVVDNNESWV